MPKSPLQTLIPSTLLLALALPSWAGEPYLLKDLNPRTFPASSEPRILGRAGNRVVFEAYAPSSYREPWGSDGTFAGTEPLLGGCGSTCGRTTISYGATDRLHFFLLKPEPSTIDLWTTDGTRAGTFQLTSPPVEPQPYLPVEAAAASTPTQVYFAASDPTHGVELWRSDGTPAGTFQVLDLRPGPDGSALSALAAFGERVVFVADDGRGPSLWVSDGTPSGTRLLLDPDPRSATQEAPAHLRKAGRFLYFTARVGRSGTELWRTDGTKPGTAKVADLAPGPESILFQTGSEWNGRLLFVAYIPGLGSEVWISNGTKAGTYRLTNFVNNGPFDYTLTAGPPSFFLDLTPRALFIADDGVLGGEVWVTEGRRGDARMVRDLCPGECRGAVSFATGRLGSLGFFRGSDAVHGAELWATDGTSGGTRAIGDFCNGSCGTRIPFAGVLGDKLGFLVYRSSQQPLELWWWRPSAPAATRVASLQPNTPIDLQALTWQAIGRRLYFSADSSDFGSELWRSNLTPASTTLVRDLDPLEIGLGSQPRNLMRLGPAALFFADGESSSVLWKTDGTASGTVLVTAGVETPGIFSTPGAELGAQVIYATGRGLWSSDGTAPGTQVLTPEEVSDASSPVVAGQKAYFSAFTPGSGAEPWVTDGTPAGTRLLADLEPGPAGSQTSAFLPLNDKLLFVAKTEEDGEEMWISDGTAAGTRIVKDLTPDFGHGTVPRGLVAYGGHAYFSVESPDPRVIWKTDGTAAGTVPAIAASPASGISELDTVGVVGAKLFLQQRYFSGLYVVDLLSPASPLLSDPILLSEEAGPRRGLAPNVAGGRLYFEAELGHLWVSDGTPGGTGPVKDSQGAAIENASDIAAFGGRLTFLRRGEDSGLEIWTTDGSPAQARRLATNGASSGFGSLLGEVGGRLLYRGRAVDTGIELWAVEP